MRSVLDFLASVLWVVAWAGIAALLFIASKVLQPYILAAFVCGYLSRHR